MSKGSRAHHGDEFGKSESGVLRGLDAPLIGAPTTIMLDGIVERESGVTPPPPPVSVKAIVITLIVMLLLGAVLFVVVSKIPPPDFVSQQRALGP